jgi:putative transposase
MKVSEFIIDETLLKVGENYVWLWVAIEPIYKIVLGIRISVERNMLVAEQFIQKLATEYDKHPVHTDGGTWYPQACKFLKLKHHLDSSFEKSIIEKEQSNMLKIELKVLMTIFLVVKLSLD